MSRARDLQEHALKCKRLATELSALGESLDVESRRSVDESDLRSLDTGFGKDGQTQASILDDVRASMLGYGHRECGDQVEIVYLQDRSTDDAAGEVVGVAFTNSTFKGKDHRELYYVYGHEDSRATARFNRGLRPGEELNAEDYLDKFSFCREDAKALLLGIRKAWPELIDERM
jgi:hypothetical protein